MNESQKPKLYIVFYSHLDTQWRWDYQHTIKEYIKNTLKDNFTLLEKYPSYIFNFSGANRYRFMKEYYPEDFETLKKYIQNNRWFPCGSSFEESDVLTPNVESIIRHILYGNIFFKEEFGVKSEEYMLPDCFGFPNTLPTILAHCGIKGFSTQKLSWGSANGIPFNIGKWIGPDGNSVIAAFNPGDYITQIKGDISEDDKWFERITKQGKETNIYKDYMYVGTGDWGGAPDEESIKNVHHSLSKEGKIEIIPSKADQFFKDILKDDISKLPTYKGELLLTNHSAGSLTSQAYVKRWNRKNELLAYVAETTSVINYCLTGKEYSDEKLKKAWQLFLSAQFHDILPGTSIPKAYEYSWNDQITSMNLLTSVINDGVRDIIYHLNTNVEGIPLTIYNPLPFDREEIVEVTLNKNEKDVQFFSIYDPLGNELPCQIKKINSDTFVILFYAKVSSMGFAVYEIRRSSSPNNFTNKLTVKENLIENEYLSIEINSNGDISQIYDKKNNIKLLSKPIRLVFLREEPKEFPAWNMDWKDREKEPYSIVSGEPKIRITEYGPVRATIQIIRESNGSSFTQEVSLGIKSKYVTINNEVEWFTKKSSLKVEFPLTINNSKAIYNTGLGIIERLNNDPKKFEVPSHQWFGLYDNNQEYGVTIFEDSKYGSDKPNDNTLRLTLLYTPCVSKDFLDQATQDFGIHNFKYAVYPYKNSFDKNDFSKKAEEFNIPMYAFISDKHSGSLGKRFSFLQIDEDGLKISALKKSEYSENIIIRILENKGVIHNNVKLNFINSIQSVSEVNGQEEFISELKNENNSIIFDITNNSIKSFSVKIKKPIIKGCINQYKAINLPLNVKAFSKDKEIVNEKSFNNNSLFYPLELLCERIIDNGVPFELSINSNNNALICNGDELTLNDNQYNYLYLLSVGANYDDTLIIKLDDKEIKLSVPKWNEYIGQWDTRIWDGEIITDKPDYYWGNIDYIGVKPGYIKKEEICYITTHLHTKDGNNLPYSYGYIFKYRIPINNVKKIIFPKNNNIIIFSATLSSEDKFDIIQATDIYDNLNRKDYNYSRFQICKKPQIETDSYLFEPNNKLDITIKTNESDSEIRYTLDGSDPDNNSEKYNKPIEINKPVILKAATFKNGKGRSEIVTASFYEGYKIKDIKYLSEVSSKYTGNGPQTLIDSQRATVSLLDKGWLGFEVNNLDVILDLGEERIINHVIVGCLINQSSWIFLPEKIEVYSSLNGTLYTKLNEEVLPYPEKNEEVKISDIPINCFGEKARYLHVIAHNIKKAPEWHHGSGGNAWLFVDEIIIK